MVKSGRPGLARAERVVFWEGVRGGLGVAEAAVAAGIGHSAAYRLFGEAGGVHDPPGFAASQHRKAWRIMKQAHHDHGGRRGRGRRVSR